LLERGHRDIAFLDCSASVHYSALDRARGYADTMVSAGLRPRVVRAQTTVPLTDRLAFIRAWLGREVVPTAVLCYSETTAQPLMMALTSLGHRVPADVSVLTFHYAPADITGVAVDTMVVPDVEVGRRGAQMLFKKIASPDVRLPAQTVQCAYAPGATCGEGPARPAAR
jgi:DNA-binding LacI/PurR family transcriptional regulator